MLAKRANTIIIVFLAILNAALFSFNLNEWNRYSLSDARIADITALLARNGVDLRADLPRRFAPLKTMTLELYPFTAEASDGLTALFFAPDETPVSSTAFGWETLEYKGKSLTFTAQGFRFEDLDDGGGPGDRDTAFRAAGAAAMSASALGDGVTLTLYSEKGSDGDYTFEYRGVYRSATVYSSFLRVRTRGGKVVAERGNFYVPKGFGGERDVYAPDEALYTLSRELRHMFGARAGEPPIIVSAVDLVYLVEDNGGLAAGEVGAEPYYMFTVSLLDEPIFVNAFTNEAKRA
ncbi:MAG: hypothetical protein LBK41_06115 [Clostridiales bacterium]|jgi:hypothetical protein|nr:hypothetical protein [Clostridiales bacterium]